MNSLSSSQDTVTNSGKSTRVSRASPQPSDTTQPPLSPQKDGKPRREGILLRESPACYRQVRERRNPDEISGSRLKVRCIRFVATSSMMKCPTGEVNQERVFIKGDIVDVLVPPTTNLFAYEDDVWIVVTKSKKGPTKLWKRRFSEIKSCVDMYFFEIHEASYEIFELGKVNRNPKIKQSASSLAAAAAAAAASSSATAVPWMPSVSFERGESLCFKVSPVDGKFLWVEAGLYYVFSADGVDISNWFASALPPSSSSSLPPSGEMSLSSSSSSSATAAIALSSSSPSASVSVSSSSSSSSSVSYSAHSIALHEALLNLCDELLGSLDCSDSEASVTVDGQSLSTTPESSVTVTVAAPPTAISAKCELEV